ncbi:major facilitator superfamily domain-containing protein 8-like isoform X1 [Branchiostoma floridae]|uniref:Major facilitator superfamily domain-containing protein 8-like isoform X1 n=1 Tax=Branchiostoma floridae TaxID=7739 RepID=A0A9J7MX13_BRAFL|nr:major facilitator superfamily domain-containing protein 8-like isoform X1 [Branchiostoma floridae]
MTVKMQKENDLDSSEALKTRQPSSSCIEDEVQLLLLAEESGNAGEVPLIHLKPQTGRKASTTGSKTVKQVQSSNDFSSNSIQWWEDDKDNRRRWWSIRIMYLTMFLSSMGFSIVVSSVWPFLRKVDHSADESFLGWVVAAYSLGQLVASPVFGGWANLRDRTKEPLLVSIVINVAANTMYSYTHAFPQPRGVYMLVARALVGFGAGNVAVVRSYAAAATTLSERTSTMATMSAFQAIGFILGPVLQTAFVPLGENGIEWKAIQLSINMYTGPGFLSAILGIINILLLIFVFKECKVADTAGLVVNSQEIEKSEEEGTVDYFAVIATNILFFVILFSFAIFETITTPLTIVMYAWTQSQAVLYNGVILGCLAVQSVCVMIAIRILSKRFNEKRMMLVAFFIMLGSFVMLIPYGDQPIPRVAGGLHPAVNITTPSPHPQNITHSPNVTVLTTPAATTPPRGCPWEYNWCDNTPKLFMGQMFAGFFLLGLSYPTSNVLSYAMYSKILGPKPQGTWMGWLTASGSLARTLGPVFVSQIYTYHGPRIAFGAAAGIVLVAIFWLIGVYRRLVPYVERNKILTSYASAD